MREILFRGVSTDSVEWVEGWFEMYPFARWPLKETIIPAQEAKDGCFHHVEVIPETVGQFTGLTDKNGKKIFEGDILDTPDRLVVVTWLAGNAQFDCDFIKYAHDIVITNFKGIEPRDFHLYEVIGNIHDNPELLEG